MLDAGCGVGAYSLLLQDLGARPLLAMEYQWERLAMARLLATSTGGGMEFLRGSVEALPLPDASIDLVFCRLVLPLVHHGRTIGEFARILSPGGRAVLMLYGPRYYLDMMKQVGLERERLRQLVSACLGLVGGAAMDLFGSEPRWRLRSGSFHLAYETRSSFERLLARHGLELEGWEEGAAKPYARARKPAAGWSRP